MLQIRESFVNETKGHRFGESDWYEPFTDDIGRLFRAMQREYGRCVSKVYTERATGPDVPSGWVFQKRVRYEDARGNHPERDYYTREVWVHVRQVPDEPADDESETVTALALDS